MVEIDSFSSNNCTKCFGETTSAQFNRNPPLDKLVKHFGTRDAWKLSKIWPQSGAIVKECLKCNYLWVTYAYDHVDIEDFDE